MKTQLIQEAKRLQKLAGILTEDISSRYIEDKDSNNIPKNIKDYLYSMADSFAEGNDNEYPVGKKMEFRYEYIEWGPENEDDPKFMSALEYLKEQGPVKLKDRYLGIVYYTFLVDDNDIVCKWVEPKWPEV